MLVSVEIVDGSKKSVHKVSEKVILGDIYFLVRLREACVLCMHVVNDIIY